MCVSTQVTGVTHLGDVCVTIVYFVTVGPWPDVARLIPAPRRPRQEDCCKFEVSLGYIGSCRLTWVTKGNHISTKTVRTESAEVT